MKLKTIKNFTYIFLFLIFAVSCEQQISMTEKEEKIDKNIKVFIKSEPTDAKIFLNGRYTGYNTPDTLTYLADEVLNFSLRKKYLSNYDFTVTPEVNADLAFDLNFYDLPDIMGTLEVEAEPANAVISYNNQVVMNGTPGMIEMKPGKHKIYCEAIGFWGDSSTVEIYSNNKTSKIFNLVDTTKIIYYTMENSGIPMGSIDHIVLDNNGSIWGSHSSNKILKFGSDKVESFEISKFGFTGSVNQLAVDNQNNLWVATTKGLIKFNGSNWELIEYNNEPGNKNITGICITENDEVWVSSNNGYGKILSGSVEWFEKLETGTSYFSSIYADNELIYLGTENALIVLNLNNNSIFRQEIINTDIHGVARLPYVQNIVKRKNGILWFTTEKLAAADNNSYLRPKLCQYSSSLKITDRYQAGYSNIVSIDKFLIISAGSEVRFYPDEGYRVGIDLEVYFNNKVIRTLGVAYDEDNKTLWVSTYDGLIKIKEGMLKLFIDNI